MKEFKVAVGISARHAHLCSEDFEILFGKDYKLTFYAPLSQLNEFASNETITIKTEHSLIEKVRILGPLRSYSQVEITKTDAHKLKIKPPVKSSGDLQGAAMITMVGPLGEVTRAVCIIACRHLHLNPKDAALYGLKDKEIVSAICDTQKRSIFQDVSIKVKDTYVTEMHIDNDESNGSFLDQGDIVEIIKGD